MNCLEQLLLRLSVRFLGRDLYVGRLQQLCKFVAAINKNVELVLFGKCELARLVNLCRRQFLLQVLILNLIALF
jgi:hypothetical protein